MTRRLIFLLLCLGAAALGGGRARAEESKTGPTGPWAELQRATYHAGRVRVDFKIHEAITDETLELIHSGIPLNFRHRIEVRGHRKYWLSTRKVLARCVVESRVTFDALTGRYELTRVTELKEPHASKGPPPFSETRVTEDTEEMIGWMTSAQQVELFDPLGSLPRGKLKVSVESSIGLRYILLFFPARQSVSVLGPVDD